MVQKNSFFSIQITSIYLHVLAEFLLVICSFNIFSYCWANIILAPPSIKYLPCNEHPYLSKYSIKQIDSVLPHVCSSPVHLLYHFMALTTLWLNLWSTTGAWQHGIFLLTLHTLASVWIFSTLFFVHFLRCWQGEYVCQSKASFPGDHFFYSHNLNVQFREKLDASHSKGVKG